MQLINAYFTYGVNLGMHTLTKKDTIDLRPLMPHDHDKDTNKVYVLYSVIFIL
jgi:hypothetical protein